MTQAVQLQRAGWRMSKTPELLSSPQDFLAELRDRWGFVTAVFMALFALFTLLHNREAVTILLLIAFAVMLASTASLRLYRFLPAHKDKKSEPFEEIVENGFDAVMLIEPDGSIRFLSRTAKSLLGVSANDYSCTEFDFVHPDDRGAVQAQHADLVRNERALAYFSYRIRDRKQKWRWVQARRSNMLKCSKAHCVVVSIRDLTVWKDTQAALARSEYRYLQAASMLEQLPVAFLSIDHHWQLTYINPEAKKFFTGPIEQIQAIDIRTDFPGSQQALFRSELEKAFLYGRPVHFEVSIQSREQHFEVRMFPSPEGLNIYFHDITERKKLEAQLRQSQKMDAIGQLSGGMAHDFNNMLTVIQCNCRLAQETLPEDHPAYERVTDIIQASNRATALTRKLMLFSRKQVFTLRTVDLNLLVSDLSNLLRRLVGEHIRLELKLDADIDAIDGDAGLLEQVLMNLVVNARDAMPNGGTLTIRTGMSSNDWVELVVSDTGVGMPEEVRLRIFEPFFTTKSEGQGTGLGLAIVYGAITEHRGKLDVQSTPGKGTAFRILLPRSSQALAETLDMVPAPSSQNSTIASAPRVVLVEDEEFVRDLTCHVLTAAGCKVNAFEQATEALAFLESQPKSIDMLITDIMLPGMGGQELAEIFRRELPEICVLLMSGHTEDTLTKTGTRSRFVSYLAKPFTPLSLTNKVREVLSRLPPKRPTLPLVCQ